MMIIINITLYQKKFSVLYTAECFSEKKKTILKMISLISFLENLFQKKVVFYTFFLPSSFFSSSCWFKKIDFLLVEEIFIYWKQAHSPLIKRKRKKK